MAEHVVKRLIDDLDGGDADEIVLFSIDGRSYEIDLSAANARRLRDCFAPFVQRARRAGGARGGRRRGHAVSNRTRSADIRSWAKAHGIPVSERGRVPAAVVAQYEKAIRGA